MACPTCGALVGDQATHARWHAEMAPATSVHRCRGCDRYRETRRAAKFGNATARRAGSWRPAWICEDCARFALHTDPLAPEGTDEMGNQWRIADLIRAWPQTNEES